MYSIILTNGQIINIKATEIEWNERTRTIRFFDGRHVVSRFNIDNIVGWVASECVMVGTVKVESEEAR